MLYSHSRLNTFKNCPYKFKLHYLDNVRVEGFETIEAFMGKRVHEALEHLYKTKMMTRLLSLDELLAYYDEEWDKRIKPATTQTTLADASAAPKLPIINREGLTHDDYKNKGRECITNYYNRYKPFDDKTIAVEKRVMIDLGDGLKLQGFIDRLSETNEGEYVIHDYKTNNNLPNQEWADSNPQLALYQIGIQQELPDVKSVELAWHFLSFDKTLRSKRDATDIEQLKQDTRATINAIQAAKNYPTRKSALCDWCEYKQQCPEWTHKLAMQEAEPNKFANDDGVQLVNHYEALMAKKKELDMEFDELKAAVADYTKKNNYSRLSGANHELIVRFYPKTSFPSKGSPEANDLQTILEDYHLFQKYATLDRYNFTKALNSGAISKEIADKIDPFLTRGETTWIKLVEKRVD